MKLDRSIADTPTPVQKFLYARRTSPRLSFDDTPPPNYNRPIYYLNVLKNPIHKPRTEVPAVPEFVSAGMDKNKEAKKMQIKITSPAFEDEGMIPARYTCDGENVSPPLTLDGIPENTQSIALIADDPDAPGRTFTHWLIFDLPPDTNQLSENIPMQATLTSGAKHGENDFGKTGYGGPCPPSGTHRYYFRAYALDSKTGLKPGISKTQLLEAVNEHLIAQGQIMGKYKRQ